MPSIARTGKPTMLTLEFEAREILRRLAPGKKTQGTLVSFLLRMEEQRRHDIRNYREQCSPVQDDHGPAT
jgi:hypothetical protein